MVHIKCSAELIMKIQIQEFLDQVDDFGLLRRVGYCELDSGFVLRFSGGCSAPGDGQGKRFDFVEADD